MDAEDFKCLSVHRWHAVSSRGRWYAVRFKTRISGQQLNLCMHREILGLQHKDGKIVDHVNSDGLDNRRSNLRICTKCENNRHRRKSIIRRTASQYKGVTWHKRNQKWMATIRKDRKIYHLGYFEIEIEAAKTYNEAAIKYHGDFACLNDLEGTNHPTH